VLKRLSHRKQGDTAFPGVVWLVLMIGLFIIVYIILLPEGEKARFIGEEPLYAPSTGGYPGGEITGGLFLSETPGVLYPLDARIVATPLASVNLFSFVQSGGQSLASLITVKRSTFTDESKELVFQVNDVAQTQQAQLLFLVKEGEGDLIISLNNHEIFSGPVSVEDLPIALPRSLLKQVNTLKFSVSKPGLNIFASHEYILKDVQVFIKHLEDNSKEVRTFVVSDSEMRNLRRMTLFFVVNCFTIGDEGRMVLSLNGKVIADGLIVCDAGPVAVDIDQSDIISGRNALLFEIDQGKYVLEQMVVEKETGQEEASKFVFTMQVADVDLIRSGAHVVMDMQFVPDGLRKIGTVYVNGFPLYVDTFDSGYVYDITGLTGPGTNLVRIVPETPLDIVMFNIGLA
jgi:hypothetical protein